MQKPDAHIRSSGALLLASCISLGSISAVPLANADSHTTLKSIERLADTPADNELMVLSLVSRKTLLHSALIAYYRGGRVYLPMGEIIHAMELPLLSTPTGLSGWLLEKSQRFSLDTQKGIVTVQGQKQTLNKTDWFIEDGTLFVDSEKISHWWHMDVVISIPSAMVSIRAQGMLPIEARQQREKNGNKQRNQGSYTVKSKLPKRRPEYRLISSPAVDFRLAAQAAKEGGKPAENSATVSMLAYSDFLYGNGQLALSVDEKGDGSAYGRWFKEFEQGNPLAGNKLEVGDVSVSGQSLTGGFHSGLGFSISNRGKSYFNQTKDVVVQVDTLANEELEVYVNGALTEYRTRGPAQEYTFERLPVRRGSNQLLFVFYGPQGQERKETRTIIVGGSTARKGELRYTLGATDSAQNLLPLDDNDQPRSERDAKTVSVSANYGLSNNLTLDVAASHQTYTAGERSRFYVGASSDLGAVNASAGMAFDDRGGYAARVGADTAVGNTDVSANYSRNRKGYTSTGVEENSPDSDSLHVNLASQKSLSLGGQTRGQWRLSAGRDKKKGETANHSANMYTQVSRPGLNVSNDLSFSDSGNENTLSGGLQLSRSMQLSKRNLPLRASARYEVEPRARVKEAALGTSFVLDEQSRLGLTTRHTFDDPNTEQLNEEENSVNLSWNKRHPRYNTSLGLGVSDNDRVNFSASIGFSAYKNPVDNSLQINSQSVYEGAGHVAALAYIDSNGNGVRDKGESLLKKPIFSANGYRTSTSEQKHNHDLLQSLSSGVYHDIRLLDSSIEDPFLAKGEAEQAIRPRPGVVQSIEIPLYPTGVIEGTVKLGSEGVGNAVIQLVKKSSTGAWQLHSQANSAADGYYYFYKVPVGEYRIQIDPDLVQQAGLQTPKSQILQLKRADEKTFNFDLFWLNSKTDSKTMGKS